ncbi:hypothetical protein K8M07_01600 [Schnuerera sp. xch1]|uniref:hypothetical protein n=1 Tax=Schnuerera sp. xch1 TaxID=2874283 RepID=UPI001CBF1EBA|nr:hypothetical protein [Schnuerera sp. xch1]MBZ2173949.1 hypothetical protein [Schnuerera sp. xch1]
MLVYIQSALIVLLVINVAGYVFVVLKQKLYLKNNMIVIENKSVTEKHLKKADMKEFMLNGTKVKSGDEIKVITRAKDKFKGTLIGAIKKEKSILMVTHGDEIKKLNIENILKFKVVSKYGKFF